MTAFEYIGKDTAVHRLNPLTKMIFILLTLVIVLICNFTEDIIILSGWLILSLCLWIAGGITPKYFKDVLKVLLGVFIFTIVVQGFMYRGETPLFTIGHWKIWGGADIGVFTYEGLVFGVAVSVKILTAVCAIIVLTTTTSTSKLMDTLTRFKIPFTYAFMLVSALRFVPLIRDVWKTIVEAQKLRAFDIDSMNIFTKARKAYIPITTPLVLVLLRKANDLQIAIESRAFGAPTKRTYMEDVSLHLRDYITILIISAVFITAVVVKTFYLKDVWTILTSL